MVAGCLGGYLGPYGGYGGVVAPVGGLVGGVVAPVGVLGGSGILGTGAANAVGGGNGVGAGASSVGGGAASGAAARVRGCAAKKSHSCWLITTRIILIARPAIFSPKHENSLTHSPAHLSANPHTYGHTQIKKDKKN